MSFDMTSSQFNMVKHRGDPKSAITLSGHRVEKQDFVYFNLPADIGSLRAGTWVTMKCADYHLEHFIYIDPLYLKEGKEGRGHWFAMCTCGSPAVIIDPATAVHHGSLGEEGNLLVCYMYMLNLTNYGVGFHIGQEKRKWQ